MTAALIWLFGAAAWGSMCNLPAWTVLLIERLRETEKPYWLDRYTVGRLAMVLFSFGVGVGSWQRGASLISNPDGQIGLFISFFGFLPHPLPIWSPFVWSGALMIAEGMFVWVAALNATLSGRRPRAWWIYIAGMVAWALAVPVFFGRL